MSSRRLFWDIYEQIASAIESKELLPGQRLPSERELADRFSVSRPTVREAIIALEVKELVDVKTGSGVYVSREINKFNNTKKINPFELTQTRALIEGEIAACAANSINDEELKQLEQTLSDMEINEKVQQADREFHHIIATSTQNNAMIQTVESLWKLRKEHHTSGNELDNMCIKEKQKTINEHREILDALKEGDANKSRQAMHLHFNRMINQLFDESETKAFEEVRLKHFVKRGKYSIDRFTSRGH